MNFQIILKRIRNKSSRLSHKYSVRVLRRVPQFLLNETLGVHALSEVERFHHFGGNEVLYRNLVLNSDSQIVVCGGYKGDSVNEYRTRYNSKVYVFEPITEWADVIRVRFDGDDSVIIRDEAVSDSNKMMELFVEGDQTGIYSTHGVSREVTAVDVATEVNKFNDGVDLLELNIEGGEYVVLNRLYDTQSFSSINYIMVQFHNLDMYSELNRAQIRMKLRTSHHLVFQYEWVWELWKKNLD